MVSDDVKSGYEILHSTTKNPEIIWNKDMLNQLVDELRSICTDARRTQLDTLKESPIDGTMSFTLNEGFHLEYACLSNHEEIGGIYIDLLLENPGFDIRNPKALFDSVMQAFIKSPDSNPDAYITVLSMLLAQHSTL